MNRCVYAEFATLSCASTCQEIFTILRMDNSVVFSECNKGNHIEIGCHLIVPSFVSLIFCSIFDTNNVTPQTQS